MSPYPDQGARSSSTDGSRRPNSFDSHGRGPRDRYQNDRKRPLKRREDREVELVAVDPAMHSEAFKALGVPVALLDALVRGGIADPFAVQSATLPDALAGRDVCGRAPTGSGKTLAYGLAVLGRIERANPGAPKALILVPTRELAKQVAEVLVPYSRVTKRWVTAFFGGAGMARQISDLQRGVDVAVATPGRLLDLINRGEARLDEVTMVIIDEADRMADMGFTPQVRQLLDDITGPRQVLLFSATLDGDVDDLVSKYMNDPVVHDIGGVEGVDELEATKRARHIVVQTRFESKYQDLAALLKGSKRAIVFVKNRFGTERAADAMQSLGVSALAMHGGMSQNARESALKRWAQGEVVALFATDVAARGVHVAGVEAVIHLDPPQDEKDYIHRSGRTARAGAHGLVVNFFRKEQLRPAAAMHRRLGVTVEQATIEQAQALLIEVRNLNAGLAVGPEGAVTETWTTATISEVDPMADEWVDLPSRGGFGAGRGERPERGGFRNDERGGLPDSRGSRDSRGPRFERGAPGDRPGFGDRARGDRPGFNSDRPSFDRDRPSFGDRARGDRPGFNSDRPSFDRDRPRTGGFDRGPRPGGFDRDARPARPPFDRDRPSFDRDRPAVGADRARGSRSGFGGDRPGFNSDRPSFDRDRPRTGGFDRGPRPGGFDRDARPARPPFDRDRPGFNSDRPGFDRGRPAFDRDRASSDRPSFGDRPRSGGFDRSRPAFADRDSPRTSGYRDDRPSSTRAAMDTRKPAGERDWKPRSTPHAERTYEARPDRPGGFRSDGGTKPYGARPFERDRNASFRPSNPDRGAPRTDFVNATVAERPTWRSEAATEGERPKRVRPPRK